MELQLKWIAFLKLNNPLYDRKGIKIDFKIRIQNKFLIIFFNNFAAFLTEKGLPDSMLKVCSSKK